MTQVEEQKVQAEETLNMVRRVALKQANKLEECLAEPGLGEIVLGIFQFKLDKTREEIAYLEGVITERGMSVWKEE